MSKSSIEYPQDLFPIGKVVKVRGLRGEVKVFLYNINSDIMDKDISLWIKENDTFKYYNVEYYKKITKYHIIKFRDIITRELAQQICPNILYISRSDLSDKKGSYLVDLIGFLIKDEFNVSYGKVIDIINLPTNNSLLINYNNKEIMIPIINDFIKLFDYENEVIIIKNSDIFIREC